MQPEHIRSLKEIRKRLLANIAKSGKITPTKRISKKLKLLFILDHLIPKQNTKRHITLPLIVWLISLTIVLILTSFRLRTVNYTAELLVNGAILKITPEWKLSEPIQSDRIYVANLSSIKSYGLQINTATQTHFNYDLDVSGSKKTWVSEISLIKGGEIAVSSGENKLALQIMADSVAANIDVSGESLVKINRDTVVRKSDESVTDRIDIYSGETNGNSVQMILHKPEKFSMTNSLMNGIAFERYALNDDGKVILESSILSGKLTIFESKQTLQFQMDEELEIKSVRFKKARMSFAGDTIRLSIEGEASCIQSGSSNFRTKLNPTFLEYFYNHERLALIYTTVFFFFSAIWSAVSFFKNKTRF